MEKETTTDDLDDFFSPKHKRLDRVARIANIFSWLVLIFYIIYAVVSFFGKPYSLILSSLQSPQTDNIIDMLTGDPFLYVQIIMDTLSIIMRGVIYGLVLKGISLGLNMIIETDLNYRESDLGSSDE